MKTTRRIKTIIKKEAVNPRVAERREWVKFGSEKGHGPGPDLSTTSVGENIIFRPQVNWTAKVAEENKEEDALKSQLKDKKVACRICKGDHFTARCPFKDTMPPLDDTAEGAAGEGGTGSGGDGPGGLGDIKGAYVAPHLRGKRGPGESMAGTGSNRFERDDLATLRVTNVSEFADEQDLRDMFGRFGHVTRVFLAKDRDTGRAKGFAFVSFADRTDAARACEKMDGCECPVVVAGTGPGDRGECGRECTDGSLQLVTAISFSTSSLRSGQHSRWVCWDVCWSECWIEHGHGGCGVGRGRVGCRLCLFKSCAMLCLPLLPAP